MDAATRSELEELKYAYFRHLDLKEFEALGALLTEDAEAAYDDGNLSFSGRDAIIEFLSGAMGNAGLISMHNGHHPELKLESPDVAIGTWYLEDRVIIPEADLEISGTAIYTDRYLRTADGWKISHTGYARIFEEQRHHLNHQQISFKSRF
ncbi:MAG: nuclear transport factor 2 family protein [Actinomycetes bacterium]